MTHNELNEKIIQACSQGSVNPSALINLISLDPVLSKRLFELYKSVFPQRENETSLVKAVTALGLNTVKNLILSVVE